MVTTGRQTCHSVLPGLWPEIVRQTPTQTDVSCQTGTMNIIFITLGLSSLNNFWTDALTDCNFEEDECGWFSGSEVGEGSFVRTTSEEQKNTGSDLYPTENAEEKGSVLSYI